MIDELDAVRRFRADVGSPSPSARLAARRTLEGAMSVDAGQAPSMGSRQSPWRGRRLTCTVGMATALAGAVAVAVVAYPSSPGLHTPQPGAQSSVAELQRAILTAFDSTSGDVLYVRLTTTVSNGESVSQEVWTSPADPQPNQLVRSRHLLLDAVGAPVQDVQLVYTMPADLYRHESAGSVPTGQILRVDYPSRTWSEQANGSIADALPNTPGVVAVGSLRNEVADGHASELGTGTVDGQPVIELSLRDPRGTPLLLWVNQQTYLPVRDSFNYQSTTGSQEVHGSSTSDYEYLAPSDGNLDQLHATVPTGFTHTATSPSRS
jgi:hypothetical protein